MQTKNASEDLKDKDSPKEKRVTRNIYKMESIKDIASQRFTLNLIFKDRSLAIFLRAKIMPTRRNMPITSPKTNVLKRSINHMLIKVYTLLT